MKGFSCLHCHFIFPREDALGENVSLRSGPAFRFRCPECHRAQLEEIVLCPCLTEELVLGEDLGRNCLAAEADALCDIELEAIEERRPKSELSLLCADIAMMPWRRVG